MSLLEKTSPRIVDIRPHMNRYAIELEVDGAANQSQERFHATVEGKRQSFEMHDYRAMYRVPMLYDAMMFGLLQCRTPTGLAETMRTVFAAKAVRAHDLRILEIGAGSGAFGEALRVQMPELGELVGLDIIDEAREAAERDRPDTYDDYLVADLTALSPAQRRALAAHRINCVAVASATGWGNHIPVAGFQAAFDLLAEDGWFIFHVKPNDPDPECVELCRWIDRLVVSGVISDVTRKRLFHRKSTSGDDIFYDVVVGRRA